MHSFTKYRITAREFIRDTDSYLLSLLRNL